jgi:TusA-related sulfurtransferase
VSLARSLKESPEGVTFELLATDPGSKSDVPSWAELSGNELVSAETLADGSFRYLIRRGS